MKTFYRWGLLLSMLVALALRLHNLTYHSLWFDEAMSVHWARQSVPRLLEVGFTLVEDRLPPLYYLMLKGWTGLAGFSEAGVRSLSVFLGVLLVPVVAGLAGRLFGRRVALVAAWLVSLNPFLIWYSQEARMYAPAVLFGALTIWTGLGLARLAKRQDRLFHLALFVLFATAGLYSHLYVGFLLPALGLWLLFYSRSRHTWLLFAAAGLIVSLAFAPLALAIWRFSGEAFPGQPLAGLSGRAWWLLQAFTVWKAPLAPGLQVAIPLALLFFAAGAYAKFSPSLPSLRSPLPRGDGVRATPDSPPAGTLRFALYAPPLNSTPASALHAARPIARTPALVLVTLLLIFPFLIATLLLKRSYLAFFGERYFIVMVPWLLLLAATGAVNLSQLLYEYFQREWRNPGRGSSFAGALAHSILPLVLLALTALPIPGQWSIPAAKEAWRQSVAYLAGRATAADAILIHPDWVRYPFQFYFRGPGQTYAAFSQVGPDTALDGPLQGVVDHHPVLWLIQSHLDGPDPDRRVEGWLAARYPLVTELYPPGISLKGFAPGYQLQALPDGATPADLRFDNGLRLVGYQRDAAAPATDALFHPPSGWVHVVLYWTATRPLGADVRPFVHLVGPEGIWGVNLERAGDALHMYPPSRWPADGRLIVRHDVDVNLNPLTPPGRYQLIVGLEGQPQQFSLAEVEVR